MDRSRAIGTRRADDASCRSPFVALVVAALVALLVNGVVGLDCARAATASADDARAIAVDPTGQSEGYSAILYNNTNGLPTSEANAIAETAEGFIWIGSYSGLIRYDGKDFVRIDSTSGIASVVSLHVDAKDRLWVGTNDAGLAVMQQGEFTIFNKAKGLRSLSVRAIAEDLSGNIYAATTQGIAVIDEAMNVTAVEDARIEDAYIRDLKTGPDGVLYGSTTSDCVFTIADGKVRDYFDKDQLGLSDIITLLPDWDNPGYVYVGTKSSEVYYGDMSNGLAGHQVIDVSPLAYVKNMNRLQGQLWICADNGIGVMKDGALTKLGNIPLNNSIDHMMVDYEGNLWFSSSRQGVMKITPNQFADLFERYHIDETVVNSTCLFEDNLFVGTDTGLLAIGEGGPVSSLPLVRAATASGENVAQSDLIQMLAGQRIRSIIRDSRQRLWISTYGTYGLIRYDGESATTFGVDDGLPSSRVRTVCETSDGSILAACTSGVARIEGDSVTQVYDAASGLGDAEILTVVEAENGDLIFGSDGDGIFVLQESGVIAIDTESGLGSDVVMRIKHDAERGVFWIVTSNSLAYMTDDYRVTTVWNFPYSNNFDLYETSQGDMWVLSSNGVYVVPVDDLLANGDIKPVFYGRANGLPCIATANSYSEKADDGNLYIAGTTGVAKVNIETPFETVGDVKMTVPFVEADDVPIYANKETGAITIPPDVQKITVHGFVYTYALVDPQVTYYLDGFDQHKTTVDRSELAPVDYTNLAGGDYRFVMQLSDSMGRGGKVISVPIVKELAFHEMLWFRIACVLAGILLVGLVVMLYAQRKIRAYQKREQENKIFIREMTEAFAKTIDMKDEYTNGHSKRVAEYTAMLTEELGYDEETVEKYYNIALLHDIGKIGIPSSVLNKPDKLTDEEYAMMKSHAEQGYRVLKDISVMPELATGAGAHHERPDGKGYPRGLKGDEIPRVAQIIAVADTFDAMYSTRAYRSTMNFERAVSIIKDVSGTQLTSDVVDAFLRLVERGEFRDPNDTGGGTMEDIDNIG